jgi:hypothetical protein
MKFNNLFKKETVTKNSKMAALNNEQLKTINGGYADSQSGGSGGSTAKPNTVIVKGTIKGNVEIQ